MASPVVSLLLYFVLSSLFLLLPFLSQATSPFGSFKLESFRAFKHLEGSKKGDKMEGIQKVKQYLQRYGYLSSTHYSQTNTDEFDDALESAIKVFQTFYHLNPTEILDILETLTVTQMSRPRCGVPDHPLAQTLSTPMAITISI
ncbi:metalloendoproteinase 3-MMP-like [Vitis riparia]|uniref:metalloendoproteinase 3-MMP-like n=1 Tax=Vitis riparia TaxID=96939 RepID=UPI00155A631C|nr:metalloendoproteinase 3-MMP-like [Vitis riparia]